MHMLVCKQMADIIAGNYAKHGVTALGKNSCDIAISPLALQHEGEWTCSDRLGMTEYYLYVNCE